jgi:hypothetical protein
MHAEARPSAAYELLRDLRLMGLQYGVPLEHLVDQFVFTCFEPAGRVKATNRACLGDRLQSGRSVRYLNAPIWRTS